MTDDLQARALIWWHEQDRQKKVMPFSCPDAVRAYVAGAMSQQKGIAAVVNELDALADGLPDGQTREIIRLEARRLRV